MNVSKWKYELVTVKAGWSAVKQRERVKQALDDMGARGWELVTAPHVVNAYIEVTLFFKRPA